MRKLKQEFQSIYIGSCGHIEESVYGKSSKVYLFALAQPDTCHFCSRQHGAAMPYRSNEVRRRWAKG